MNTPETPSTPSTGDGAAYEDAQEVLGAVLAWYSRAMMEARRSGDEQRLEELTERMRACAEDRRRLVEATPEEIERTTELYGERLRDLEAEKN
ncbi:hypothetical protein CFP65_1990 [Kitasatospora sp. MMS16-BH015]|uniref:hypothetical protein n=1 Tax=Kitasatospora sp. MMS16-BH015 TaxID=2018025 RepID=UPI000CA3A2EE|nr:hypothetical protein [Kitasatospora sp. MMS16-BH015]AUG76855.1 hypothetical protein CFP65_1990 [Kitasatospora sp. MMS16-BH015]